MRRGALLSLLLWLPILTMPGVARADRDAEERRLNDLALDRMLAGQVRVMRVADLIRIAGAGLCGRKVEPVLGLFAADEDTFGERFMIDLFEPFVERASERFDLGEQPRVLAVAPGLPAADAGVRPGDVVTSVGGEPAGLRGDLVIPKHAVGGGAVRLGVLRGGEPIALDVVARTGCKIPSRYQFGTAINAYATSFGDLTGVYFYDGFLEYFPDDNDLAIVVGHEFAHLVRGHTSHLRVSNRFENEADVMGLYFAARAGFDVTRAPALWDRFSRQSPYSSVESGFYSHPMSASRALTLQAVSDRIARQREAGDDLAPDESGFAHDLPDVSESDSQALQEAQREAALRAFRSDQARIVSVAHRLATSGVDLCPKQQGVAAGLLVGRRQDFGRRRKDQVAAAFGATDKVSIFAVAPGSPADQAGLAVGDQILRMDGSRVRNTKKYFDLLRKAGDVVSFEIERDGEKLELPLRSTAGCAFGVLVLPYPDAYTNGQHGSKEMTIAAGLVRFTKDEDELAIAISHQMAHQILRNFRSVKHEPLADELGLRLAHTAGYDVSKAPSYWDRWASVHAWTIGTEMGTRRWIPHGAMVLRAPTIRRAAAELSAQAARSTAQ